MTQINKLITRRLNAQFFWNKIYQSLDYKIIILNFSHEYPRAAPETLLWEGRGLSHNKLQKNVDIIICFFFVILFVTIYNFLEIRSRKGAATPRPPSPGAAPASIIYIKPSIYWYCYYSLFMLVCKKKNSANDVFFKLTSSFT